MTGGRRLHLLGVSLASVLLLGVGTMLDGWLPADTDDPGSEPFVRVAALGEPVDLRTARVQVDVVRTSRTLVSFGSELRSPGVWVLVEYSVEAVSENTSVGFAELRDDAGRVWTLSGGRNRNQCLPGPPGVPIGCAAYFEVPPDALDTLRLRLARSPLEQRYDVVAEVDLALTGQDAAGALDAPALEVPEQTLGGS